MLNSVSKTYDELSENFTANTKIIEGNLFSLRRKGKDLTKFSDDLTRLSQINDKEGIEALGDTLKEFNKDLAVFDLSTGQLNIESTLSALSAAQEENLNEVRENFNELFEEAQILRDKDLQRFLKDEDGALSAMVESVFFIEEQRRIKDGFEVLTTVQNDAFRDYIREQIKTLNHPFFNSDALRNNLNNFLETVDSFEKDLVDISKNLQKNESRFSKSFEAYNNALNNLSGSTAISTFKQTYRSFSNIVELFGDDADQFANIFDIIGFEGDRFNNLTAAFSSTNASSEALSANMQELFGSIQKTFDRLQNVPAELRMTTAIAEVARTTEDAKIAMTLFGLATEKTVLEIAQSADLLSSRIKRLSEEQQKFLSGEISDQELFELIENYSDFFADQSFFNDFINGRDLSIRLLEQEIDIQYEYQRQLILTRAELQRAMTDEENYNADRLQGLRAEEARLMLLTRYRGELQNVTQEQHIFNQTLSAYNNLVDLGFKNIGVQTKLVEAMRNAAGSTLRQIQDDIQSITRSLASRGIDESVVRIVDGVAVLQKGFSELDATTQQYVERLLLGLEDQLSAMRDFYKTLSSESIKLEKEMADKKIKVYQDYFSALDRLEEQRRRATSREDLVEQLSRLEGATDERSRKRALDIRKQLNSLDEDTSKKAQEASRASMIATINESVEKLQQAFESA